MKYLALLFVGFSLVTGCSESSKNNKRDTSNPEPSEESVKQEDNPFKNLMIIDMEEGDELFVNNESLELENLHDKICDFYLVNRVEQKDSNYPSYDILKRDFCVRKLHQLKQKEVVYDEEDTEMAEMETKVLIFNLTGLEKVRLIDSHAMIQINSNENSSFDFEDEVYAVIDEAFITMRQLVCDELNWGSYLSVDEYSDSMKVLETLIPERIVESF